MSTAVRFEDHPDYVAMRSDLAEVCDLNQRTSFTFGELEELRDALDCAVRHVRGLLAER